MIILINNKFVREKDAKVSVLSEAFMYGYGVFETMRTYARKGRSSGWCVGESCVRNIGRADGAVSAGEKYIFEAKAHVDRLFKSVEKIGLKIKYSREEVLKMLEKVIKKSPEKIQRIKIIAIKEGVIVTSTKLEDGVRNGLWKREHCREGGRREKGVSVGYGVSVKTVQMARGLPEVKSISYLSSYLSHKEATSRGYYEAILVDEKGEVFEGAYSNIFWFEGDTLCTRKDGVLQGITAQVVVKLAVASPPRSVREFAATGSLRSIVKVVGCPQGIGKLTKVSSLPFKVKFKKINIKNLLKKSEVFLTQTTKGIVPVVEIDGKRVGNGKVGGGRVGERTKILMKRFSDFANGVPECYY